MIPLVVGAFREVNKDSETVLKSLARMTAEGGDGMSISSLHNLDRTRGAYDICY